jgi:hypothetical protein
LECAGQRPLGLNCKFMLMPRDKSSQHHDNHNYDHAQRNA